MFSPIKSTKVYEQVMEQIKKMIVDGSLKTGDKLPSERELVERFQVSRTSIREALRALQIIGLVECKQGEGNYINHSFKNSLFEHLSMIFMIQESNPVEIIEVRRVIEVGTAAMAAKRITNEELESLEILVGVYGNSRDEEENVKIDKKLHYEIAQASGNYLISNILNAISSLIDSFIKDARKKILVEERNAEILAKQHWEIYEALKNHNPKKASEAMKKHLEFTNEYMLR
ncbi:FadR family transcriptional regulator [Clostridiaceae bacterium UIB06]|uniref:FadR family transcriptional regulator n=1 Tax=Clostridium thailandense TaxID=2794346 RepID=A0A949TPN0_9CLOT|nr:FadR/GntR family transcriptional regulator [Clostridium thailandense]MBV7276669.1 FadR family transcriptional regulator [Clostridium thailandense]MCH5137449.1 FadR family transcriptional regulator [Clostridiaceae bacterium UIB06]